jgi:hypothetical protein
MWGQRAKSVPTTTLSPKMTELWGYLTIRFLVLATDRFIVFIDDQLEVDWKTTQDWDCEQLKERGKHSAILNRAAAIEAADWDSSDEQKTLSLRRQIGEAIARCLDHDYANAEQMLDQAQSYRTGVLSAMRRKQAIEEQVQIKNVWKNCYDRWTVVHYVIGMTALLFSTLVASKPALLGATDSVFSFFAWLAALFTGILTFLTPDKKAGKYGRAWSVLNSQITRYNADETYTVNDVLEAYNQGESVISESAAPGQRRTRGS